MAVDEGVCDAETGDLVAGGVRVRDAVRDIVDAGVLVLGGVPAGVPVLDGVTGVPAGYTPDATALEYVGSGPPSVEMMGVLDGMMKMANDSTDTSAEGRWEGGGTMTSG